MIYRTSGIEVEAAHIWWGGSESEITDLLGKENCFRAGSSDILFWDNGIVNLISMGQSVVKVKLANKTTFLVMETEVFNELFEPVERE